MLLAGLVRAIMAELLGMSAGALGGIHLVLAGPSAAAAAASSSQACLEFCIEAKRQNMHALKWR